MRAALLSCAGVWLWASAALANCDFQTAAHREALSRSDSIQAIDIKIAKSRKWVMNGFRILTSKHLNIQANQKKKFNAAVIVRYPFGTCEFPAKVRQNGDWKDHIRFRGGQINASLDVDLKAGNILNAVSFKLLLPETRGGEKEVLATTLMRAFGFMAPETFLVRSAVNGVSLEYLFQENTEKELLERHLRREGPIFEGDEALLWSFQDFANFELEDVALARMSNWKWALKGDASTDISLEALARLQAAYLQYTALKAEYGDEMKSIMFPNGLNDAALFTDYSVLLYAIGGNHALHPHNRKFYFNSFEQRFEPIYYDGNVNFPVGFQSTARNMDLSVFLSQIDGATLQRLQSRLADLRRDRAFEDEVAARMRQSDEAVAALIDQAFENAIANIDFMRNHTLIRVEEGTRIRETAADDFAERLRAHRLATSIARYVGRAADQTIRFMQTGPDGAEAEIALNIADTAQLMARNTALGARTVLLPGEASPLGGAYAQMPFLSGEILHATGGKVRIDEAARSVTFTQTDPTDWFLIRNTDLKDWRLTFVGLAPDLSQPAGQRFNRFGLTGCLNLYGVTLSGVEITATDGGCEDSVNLVSARGALETLVVERGFADAVDIDFSEVAIAFVNILTTGNDCFDVSGGAYDIDRMQLLGCADKGVSVGENSTFTARVVNVDTAAIGVSSKDFSVTTIESFSAKNTPLCAEAFRKKQEFGGGALSVAAFDCAGDVQADAESRLDLPRLSQ